MGMYSRPEELLEVFRELFNAQKGILGFAYVATQEENLIPEYPALQVSMGGVSRQDHGTQRFLLTFEASFWIYHASLESDHATRTIEDMKLATAVVKFLHLPNNRALRETDTSESKLISGSGRVVLEQPGITNTGTGAGVITTRLGWMGQSQVNYGDS
jgi:hypothetical protein